MEALEASAPQAPDDKVGVIFISDLPRPGSPDAEPKRATCGADVLDRCEGESAHDFKARAAAKFRPERGMARLVFMEPA